MSRRLALVVANDSYSDPDLTSLIAPRNDAQSLRELLRDPEIGNYEPADILVNESKSEIERATERMFRSARPGDLVLLYFSGHGVRSRNGRLHLAVANTDLSLLSATSVSASFVKELIDESDAASTVILLDCCYSGAFSDNGLKADPTMDVGHELRAGRGTYVLTASSSVETAGDGERPAPGRQPGLSVFTEAVVRGLATGSADVRGIGRITPNDLWEYVRQEVPRRTVRQTPTQYGYVEDEIHLANVRRGFSGTVLRPSHRVHLGDLLGPLSQTADQGLRAEEWLGTGRLVVPVGQAFRGTEPAETVCLNLAHNDGHVLVVGRIGSGKSTLLRTLVGALALTSSPGEVRFYFLESGGNKLGSLRRLPYVARIARDDQPDLVRDLLDEVGGIISRRKQLYSEHFVDSAERFRVVRRDLPGGPHPDVFLFVDRWADFASHGARISALAGAGLDYGVHLVVSARGWRDVPDELQELIHCQIELHLSRPSESRIDPRLAEQAFGSQPGWALRQGGRFLVALPHLGSAAGTPDELLMADSSDGALELVDRVVKAWSRIGGRPLDHPDQSVAAARPLTIAPSVLDLLGLAELSADRVAVLRAGRTPDDRLRVPIGVDPAGEPVLLDLKPSTEGGAGPHGLLVGATGSGKSQLLRSLLTTLALTHDPAQLTFVLVTYKGGDTFAPFERLPHTGALVDRIADELSLLDRLIQTISGELTRRQGALRAAGNLYSQHEYERVRATGTPLAPMPALLVVCDEFTELLTANPNFLDLLVQVGRVGRSLGVHLLLAAQRLEEGRLRGLETHLAYRI
ncbi:MAG TPA: FtsK/SpoIIIE domain-containing protein, partial [Micromonospora sp.]